MVDRAIALEALGATCNANITSLSGAAVVGGVFGAGLGSLFGGPPFGAAAAVPGRSTQLVTGSFIPTVLDGEQTCSVSQYNLTRIQDTLLGSASVANPSKLLFDCTSTSRSFVIDEEEFFDPEFDYDFRRKTDTVTYYRGGEEYTRPNGWYRFALKVLNKYENNTWLGNQDRTTESVPGEWPVSYHGTSYVGAKGIVKGHFKAGEGKVYGRGVYSTPDLSEAEDYAKRFISKKDGKTYKVVLQNRINPEYREKHNNSIYWLISIPKGTTAKEEQHKVERAIRPYGLLLKEI